MKSKNKWQQWQLVNTHGLNVKKQLESIIIVFAATIRMQLGGQT